MTLSILLKSCNEADIGLSKHIKSALELAELHERIGGINSLDHGKYEIRFDKLNNPFSFKKYRPRQ